MLYIRFKDIPEDEISRIHDGDLGCVGEELGVSCYECIKEENYFKIVLPSLDDGVLYDLMNFKKYPSYLITGDVVGKGNYNEPVLKNINIVGKLELVNTMEPKFKLDKSNLCLQLTNNKDIINQFTGHLKLL